MGKIFYFVLGVIAGMSAFAGPPLTRRNRTGAFAFRFTSQVRRKRKKRFKFRRRPALANSCAPTSTRVINAASCSRRLTKDGKLVNGWRPQLSEVPGEFEEILLPKTPVKWDWSTASGPFDLYVLFLEPGSKEIDEAKKLIDAMQKLEGRPHPGDANGKIEGTDRQTGER